MTLKMEAVIEFRKIVAHKIEHRYGVTMAGTHAAYCVFEFLDGHTVMMVLALVLAILLIAGLVLGLHE